MAQSRMRPSFLLIKAVNTKFTFAACVSVSVFQSKVLQRLYPTTPELEKKQSPPRSPENLTNQACVNRKSLKDGPVVGKIPVKSIMIISKYTVYGELLCFFFFFPVAENKETTQSAANPGRRVYTVLPPPADYRADAGESVKLLTSGSTDSDKDSAGETTVIGSGFLCLCFFFFYLCVTRFCLI